MGPAPLQAVVAHGGVPVPPLRRAPPPAHAALAPDEHALVDDDGLPADVVGAVLEDDHVAVARLLDRLADGPDAEGPLRRLLARGLRGGLRGHHLAVCGGGGQGA